MPVFLVKADSEALQEQPSWLVDLNKIYTEVFDASAPAFVAEALTQPNSWFAGGLFNDHLLGAVLVTEETDGWQLTHLRVRKVTQRRGVATRLLNLLAAEASKKNLNLCFTDLEANEAGQALVEKLGFEKTPQGLLLKCQ
ncbi:GNAT family N-acetyltransferase [Marinospirillum insulare]|uniref:Acetyltransferase (GNAT) family protein n=1 Tax=Marinospirillum insulare TaxID=217169 RepID=A0ABQ5ZS37_9GAMM|nr:acetyl-CoA sensor PanZ family protein [Marinospirillum insulare]GLR62946.1 hypothetical protein GCM10007878_03810 [Marinospirillum insulare]